MSSDSGQLTVLLGNGDGTFLQTTAPAVTFDAGDVIDFTFAAVADFNGDGKADLILTGYNANNGATRLAIFLLGNGDGTFTPSSDTVPNEVMGGIALGDFSGDGRSDMVITYPLHPSCTACGLSGGGYDVFLSQPTLTATAMATGVAPGGTGIHQVAANYPGDSNDGSSVSATTGLVAPSKTTLTLVANPATSAYGQQVVLTATLSPYSFLNGTSDREPIFFYSGATFLGTVALTSGVATMNVTSLQLGADSLSASYNGDTALNGSTSNTVPYTVLSGPALTFAVADHTYGDAPFLVAATSKSTGAITYSVVSGPAAIAGSTVTLTGAGTVVLQASQAATSSNAAATQTVSVRVNQATLVLSANNAARVFGAANLGFTGAVAGAVNGDAFTETFSTTATSASIVGSYLIVPSVTGVHIGNYIVTANNGTLTVSQAGTATTLLSQTRT